MTTNPIKSVTPVTESGVPTGAAVTNLPSPSGYEYNLHDISGPDAGRVESMLMKKMRKGQSISIDLEYSNVTFADCATLLTAFNSEYIEVEYLDAKAGGYLTKVFYVGDRRSPMLNATLERWRSVGFTIIQQGAD